MYVSNSLEIPDGELEFATSRSSGPGGQNVNKVSTRVTLLWNVATAPSLSVEQRVLLLERLAPHPACQPRGGRQAVRRGGGRGAI
jgi:ribosome-associated protein